MFIEMTIALLALTCSPTKFENTSSYPWNEEDMATYRHVQKRCPVLYPKSSCVSLFRKHAKKGYSVLCAEPKKN